MNVRYEEQTFAKYFPIIQNTKKKKNKMNQLLTPFKQNNQTGKAQSKSVTQTREGDWICYNCSNLNFSFRKKCNRCRVQTKEQNEHVSNYYYHYFPQECYALEEKQNFPSLNHRTQEYPASTQKTEIQSSSSSTLSSQKQRFQQTPKSPLPREQLPSVSPLVKRYNHNESISTQENKTQGLFEDDCLWANINLSYLDESITEEVGEENNEIPYQIEEIQKIIRRIIL